MGFVTAAALTLAVKDLRGDEGKFACCPRWRPVAMTMSAIASLLSLDSSRRGDKRVTRQAGVRRGGVRVQGRGLVTLPHAGTFCRGGLVTEVAGQTRGVLDLGVTFVSVTFGGQFQPLFFVALMAKNTGFRLCFTMLRKTLLLT